MATRSSPMAERYSATTRPARALHSGESGREVITRSYPSAAHPKQRNSPTISAHDDLPGGRRRFDAGFALATILAMSRSRAFEVVFDTLALVHMDGIESTYHTLTRKTIDEQLVVV